MVKKIIYDRSRITPGILHFGVGNFHRAHEEFYTHQLLESYTDMQGWGIQGAMLLPSDEKLFSALNSQGGCYTLTVCGRDGIDKAFEIGSLCGVLWSGDALDEIIEQVSNPAIKILSMTITEGGYNIDKKSGEFMFDKEDIQHDLSNPGMPVTVFGIIAEGLRRRRERGSGGVTILSCDNLQHNGDTAKRAFLSFFNAQDRELGAWVKENVTFPNSMVDRITPATLPTDIDRLNKKNGTEDKAPVYCEDYIQWVIEDKFIAGRPNWEAVGVQFTDDVMDYEQMKLSLLNASHTLLSYPSFLTGYRKVDDAVRDDVICRFIRVFMDEDVTPYLKAPAGVDIEKYKQTLIERFTNKSVSDQIARLCADGFSKFPVYVNPLASKMLDDRKDMSRIAYLLASYRHYLKYRKDDHGVEFNVMEPWKTKDDENLIESDNPLDFLSISAFKGTDYNSVSAFTDIFTRFCAEIKEKGAYAPLKSMCARRDSNPHVVRH